MGAIDVKMLDLYVGIIGGTDSVIIEVFMNTDTGNKYFSFSIFDNNPYTHVYQYPDVNPIIYSLIDYIEQCGPTRIENGSVYGPHLIRKKNPNRDYYIYETYHEDETFILHSDIVTKETPIPNEEWFMNLINKNT